MRTNLEKAVEKLNIIGDICTKLEYKCDSVEKNEVGVPTIIINAEKNYKDKDIIISCNLIPMHIGGIDVLFLQYYTCLAEEINESQKALAAEFVKKQNESFMVGNVMEFMDGVCMKHTLYLDPDEELDAVMFARTLDIFAFQANTLVQKLDEILAGKSTVDEAMSVGTFF